jgi:hypothetical protein
MMEKQGICSTATAVERIVYSQADIEISIYECILESLRTDLFATGQRDMAITQ